MRKDASDKKKKTGEKSVKIGDEVIIKQTKTTIKPLFDPSHYKVVEVKGTK